MTVASAHIDNTAGTLTPAPDARTARVDRLYHYQAFTPDRAEDGERLLGTLADGKIYMSRPNSFNDPWDCRPWYNTNVASDPTVFQRNLDSYAALTRRMFPGIPDNEMRRRVEAYRRNPAAFVDCIPQISAGMWEAINDRYRVYCLSPKSDSELMWAHYGRSHTGICLEFSAEEPPLSGALKVSYQTDYPSYDWASDDLHEVLSVLLTKSIAWSYEEEFRLVLQSQQYVDDPRVYSCDATGHFKLPVGALKRIILGSLATQQTLVAIADLIKQSRSPISLVRAFMANDRYRIVVPA